jgi:hypothetical protein
LERRAFFRPLHFTFVYSVIPHRTPRHFPFVTDTL